MAPGWTQRPGGSGEGPCHDVWAKVPPVVRLGGKPAGKAQLGKWSLWKEGQRAGCGVGLVAVSEWMAAEGG